MIQHRGDNYMSPSFKITCKELLNLIIEIDKYYLNWQSFFKEALIYAAGVITLRAIFVTFRVRLNTCLEEA